MAYRLIKPDERSRIQALKDALPVWTRVSHVISTGFSSMFFSSTSEASRAEKPEALPNPVASKVASTKLTVLSMLKDPDSARFGGTWPSARKLFNGKTYVSVCGTVQAKNSYGGYASESRFVLDGRDGVVHLFDADARDRVMAKEAWSEFCD